MGGDNRQGTEHFTDVNGTPVFLWRKTPSDRPADGTVLLVHGSSMASQASFDLQAPGIHGASFMDWLVEHGFDTWCFDCRGYGRSPAGDDFMATIAQGAEDLDAVSRYIMDKTGAEGLLTYGVSSGALRAGLFAQNHPDRVRRLVLDALVWTGKDSRTLAQRRQKLDQWLASPRRPLTPEFLNSIFTRDKSGTVRPDLIQPFIDAVLALEDSVPNGTYVDMCQNLPVLDPTAIEVPTLVMRGELDGIASFEDVWQFFLALPNADKEFAMMPRVSHASLMNKNYRRVYDLVLTFFRRPELEI